MDTTSLSQLVLAAGFVIGLGFGVVAQLTRFGTMGAIADAVVFGDATRLRMWVWAVLVALLGTQALIGLGDVDLVGFDPHGRRLRLAVCRRSAGLRSASAWCSAVGCPSRALVRPRPAT